MSTARAPYKMYHPAQEVESLDTHGQSWRGETVEENIELCRYQLIEPFFRKHLPRDGKCLESGCGIGRWVFYLRKLGYDIIGIDLAKDALQTAASYDPDAPIYAEDILHTSYPEKHFDAVISLGVLEHFEEGPKAALMEARRLLKDDGLFFVTVPLQNLSRILFANPMKTLKRHYRSLRGTRYLFEEYRYRRKEFEKILHESGFEIVVTAPDDFLPPMSIGLWVDYPFLRHRTRKWKLNWAGRIVRRMFDALSPWFATGGILWICRKHS